MPRKKKYNEEEVIEKAMNLFWINGYETTSVRMLEETMGINQFSMYSSFENKQGVLVQSIKCYLNKVAPLINEMEASDKGVEAIQTFFFDFLEFILKDNQKRGCLVNNTLNELGGQISPEIIAVTKPFGKRLSKVLMHKLATDTNKDKATLTRQANYLRISLQGLTASTKIFNRKQLNDFITTTFENL